MYGYNRYTCKSMHVQKLDGFLDHVMSEGLIGDGTLAPDVSKVSCSYKCYSLLCHLCTIVLYLHLAKSSLGI